MFSSWGLRDAAPHYRRGSLTVFDIEAVLIGLVPVDDEGLGRGFSCLAVNLDHPVAVRQRSDPSIEIRWEKAIARPITG